MRPFPLLTCLILVLGAFPQNQKWDFEEGISGWKAWGTTAELGDTSGIVTISEAAPHGGKKCLQVNDSFTNGNPYTVFVAAVDPQKSYLFTGWIKGEEVGGADRHIWIMGVNKAGGAEKVVKIVGPDTIASFGIGTSWQRFRIVLPKLGPETTHVYLAVRPARGVDRKWRGKIWLDDLAFFAQETKPLDISGLANRGFRDETAGDGKGGWTDQGDNDLRGMKGGPLSLAGVDFKVLDSANNGGKSAIVLRPSQAPSFAGEAAIPVETTCDYLYLLHAAAWAGAGAPVGSIVWEYGDGTTRTTAVVSGDQVGDWWGGLARNAFSKGYDDLNPSHKPVYLFVTGFANPVPEKPVKRAVLKSAEKGQAIWMVLAAVAGTGDNVVESSRSAERDAAKWKPFAPGLKTTAAPLLDLSFLLDAPAGKHGFVKVKGGHFVFEDGSPARFVAVNLHSAGIIPNQLPSKDQMDRVARVLSRYGVNLVRLHLMEYILVDAATPDRLGYAGPEVWDRFDYLVKAFKDRGIYVELDSISGLSAGRPGAGVFEGAADYPAHRAWWGYHPKLSEIGKAWAKAYLLHTNAYTGKRLIDEPAVAMMMLVNEQSVFFDWKEPGKPTPPAIRAIFNERYNAWLAKKFRDRAGLEKAWKGEGGGSALAADEDPVKGTVNGWDLYALILLQNAPVGGSGKLAPVRVESLVRFLKDLQKEAYGDYLEFLKALGLKVPVAGSNILYDLSDLETCLETGFTSQNMYYEHVSRVGDALAFQNVPEMFCDPISSGKLVHPGIAACKVATLPVTSTEHDTMWPQEWRSAHNLSVYSVAALQDWDAIFWYNFMGGFGLSWDEADKMGAIPFSTVEFNDAALAGMLPAAALLYHRRDVSPAKRLVEVVHDEKLSLGTGARLRNGGFPWNYLTWVSRVEGVFGKADGRAQFTVGPAGAKSHRYGAEELVQSGADHARELDAALKKEGLLEGNRGLQDGRVVSDTGELTRDWKKGLLLIDTPRTQAFSGFPAEEVKLGDVTVKLGMPFATIAVQSLENAPILTAKKLLLTAVARVENDKDTVAYGQTVPTPNGGFRGERILVTPAAKRGVGATARMELVEAVVAIAGGNLRVTPIAADGSALEGPQTIVAAGGKASIRLGTQATVWYLVERI
ncbi:MAG: hypothetical protein J0L75_01025 [Spirochaetes bacterium]|nr:hypothetical protein [Spirochaetota bacterium]